MSKRIDITGQRFGRLTVLRFSHIQSDKYSMWLVRCDCGDERVVRGTSLVSGNTTQCTECQRLASKGNTRAKKHGHSSQEGVKKASPTYESWKAMWARCTNPNNASWVYYGGRGIAPCDEWKDYEVFLSEMGERPPGTTLHRIDGDGPYNKSNCVWATSEKQRHTQRQGKRPPESLVGQRFGRLIAVRFSHMKDEHAYWLCKCDCGGEKVVAANNLKRGHTKSCGCMWRSS